jgi:Fe-Mn family superoxide dismutase
MEIHHGTHHATYVKNLNAALEKYPDFQSQPIEHLLRGIDRLPGDIQKAVRNNGGGHVNHSLFWTIMAPRAGGSPTGAIGDAISRSFGGFDAFKKEFSQAAVGRFGSGWAWVIADGDRLTIESTANQDSPLMEQKVPVLGLDVWEHAYYLKYQSKRAAYIEAWWNVVNWVAVNSAFEREMANSAAR